MSSFGAPYAPSEHHLPVQVARYRVVRRLAKGTTSEIFLACQEGPLGFERFLTLKLLLPDLRGDAGSRDAMLCEAAAYARVAHPAIVRLHDFIEHERRLGIVIEHVDGLPLNELRAQLYRRSERLSDAASLYAASRLFGALSAAHAARDATTGEFTPVIHADVNPSNVLVPWDGYVKLIDFGSARVAGMVDRAAAPAVHPYLAPEQARGLEVTTRADVYSGCLLLWELLTDRRAIAPNQRSTSEMLLDIARPKIPSLASLRPDLPLSLVSVVDRGIQPHAERRQVAAADVFAALCVSTDLGVGRLELAAVIGKLRPAPEAERFETTPQLPDVFRPMVPPPRVDKTISATFWLADDSGSPPTPDVSADDLSAPGTRAPDNLAAPVSETSPRTNPPLVLGQREPRPSGPSRRVRAVVAFAAAAAVLMLAVVATIARSTAPQHHEHVAATAPQGPRPAMEPVATRSAIDTAAPAFDGGASTGAQAAAPCSSPGWVVVPPSRAGHRVWIDGRIVGQSPGRFLVSSGRHVVRVGSRGVERSIVLGCAEEQLAR